MASLMLRAPRLPPTASIVLRCSSSPNALIASLFGMFNAAIDFRTGRTVYKQLAGSGLGFNNNYAPVTLGPDGTAYVGVLGGLVALRDGS